MNRVDGDHVTFFVLSVGINKPADQQLLTFEPRILSGGDNRPNDARQKQGSLLPGRLADGQYVFQVRVRSRNDVNADQLSDAARSGSAGIGSGLDGCNVSTNNG